MILITVSPSFMRNVLIISPHFPPINAADMHRVRHSLPYFQEMGWNPMVLAVDPEKIEGSRDFLLLHTVPDSANVQHVGAFSTTWTRRLGVGNPALRSLAHHWWRGSQLLKNEPFDLVYFSTTAFPVTILGRYWKARFGIPYVIDVQDPWLSRHIVEAPKEEQLPKAQWAYRMSQVLEPIAMGGVDGIISVSQGYCDTLVQRYPNIRPDDCAVIPFGAASVDFDVLDGTEVENPFFSPDDDFINVAYVGRAGHDMDQAAHGLFGAFARGLRDAPELFEHVRMHFVGTRYAPDGQASPTLLPIAEQYGVVDYVMEQTARVPYFQALNLLRNADMVVLLGSTDPNYTASKLYPYILARRPLLAVFNENSSVVDVLEATEAGTAVTYTEDEGRDALAGRTEQAWTRILKRLPYTPDTNWEAFAPYTAEAMTRRQVRVFNRVVAAASR